MEKMFQEVLARCRRADFLESVMTKAHYGAEDRELLWSVLEKILACMEQEGCWSEREVGQGEESAAARQGAENGLKERPKENAALFREVVMTLGNGIDELQEAFLQEGKLTEGYMVEVLGSEILLLAYGAYNEWVKAQGTYVVRRYHFLGTEEGEHTGERPRGEEERQAAERPQGEGESQTVDRSRGEKDGQTAENSQGEGESQTVERPRGEKDGQTAEHSQGEGESQTAERSQGEEERQPAEHLRTVEGKQLREHVRAGERPSLSLLALPGMLERSGIGVSCTGGFCMVPKKSVAFYAELSKDASAVCEGICVGCGRRDCPNRMESVKQERGNKTLDHPLTYGYARIFGVSNGPSDH